MNGTKAHNPITYLKGPNDGALENVVRALPEPAKEQVKVLVCDEKISILEALERLGFLIASR